MKTYNCCVVGIGAVGAEMVKLLRHRTFPVGKLVVVATRARTEVIDGVPVETAREALGLGAAKLPIKTKVVTRLGGPATAAAGVAPGAA